MIAQNETESYVYCRSTLREIHGAWSGKCVLEFSYAEFIKRYSVFRNASGGMIFDVLCR